MQLNKKQSALRDTNDPKVGVLCIHSAGGAENVDETSGNKASRTVKNTKNTCLINKWMNNFTLIYQQTDTSSPSQDYVMVTL